MSGGWLSLEDRLRERLDAEMPDMEALAQVVYDAIARHLDYDFACLAVTDPASGVITWASKTRDLGVGDEEFAAAEYGSPVDVIKFAEVARRTPPAAALWLETGGHPELSHRHREFMQPRFGFTDELRAAFVSRNACWGAIGISRGTADPPFTQAEVAEVATVCELVAEAIQRTLFRLQPVAGTAPAAVGPAVLIVGRDQKPTHLTPAARAAIDDLGGYDHGHLPANVLGVVETTRSRGEAFETRTQLADGRWLSLRAALLDSADGEVPDVVLTIDPTSRSALSRLALAAHGLTTREEDVAVLVLQGVNTQGIADSLHLSPYTVQDHLKTIFTKLGVRSRREMTARLTLG